MEIKSCYSTKFKKTSFKGKHSNQEGIAEIKTMARTYFWWSSVDLHIEK